MVKRLKRRRDPTLADKARLDAALARMKGGTGSDEDFELVRAAAGATLALRDQVAAMSDAELSEWLAKMRRQLR
jgi:hypothetical protein